jgi:hypothetical protein
MFHEDFDTDYIPSRKQAAKLAFDTSDRGEIVRNHRKLDKLTAHDWAAPPLAGPDNEDITRDSDVQALIRQELGKQTKSRSDRVNVTKKMLQGKYSHLFKEIDADQLVDPEFKEKLDKNLAADISDYPLDQLTQAYRLKSSLPPGCNPRPRFNAKQATGARAKKRGVPKDLPHEKELAEYLHSVQDMHEFSAGGLYTKRPKRSSKSIFTNNRQLISVGKAKKQPDGFINNVKIRSSVPYNRNPRPRINGYQSRSNLTSEYNLY